MLTTFCNTVEQVNSHSVVNMHFCCEGKKDIEDRLCRDSGAPRRLELRKGMSVMLTSNMDPGRGLLNGTTGIILDIILNDSNETKMYIKMSS